MLCWSMGRLVVVGLVGWQCRGKVGGGLGFANLGMVHDVAPFCNRLEDTGCFGVDI